MNVNSFNRQYKILILMFIMLLCCCLLSCINTRKEKKGSIYAFSTYIDITLYYNDDQDIDLIYQNVTYILNNLSKLTDKFNEYPNINNIYTINNSLDFVLVDDNLLDIILLSQQLKDETNGYFEPLIGNLSNCYKELIKKENPSSLDIITLDLINQELEIIKNSEIIINEKNVKINGDATIDLGAIAKGYALLKVKEYLETVNITHYIIDAGMSSIIVGEKPIDEYYTVGISNTKEEVKIKNKCFGTSSTLLQQVEINDKIYHHIVNPINGKTENFYDTVCIIGDNPCLIDALTTAFISMTEEEIKQLVKYYKDVGIELEYFLFKDKELIYHHKI